MEKRKLNRRDFLRLSAGAATGAALAACAPAAPQIIEVEKEVPVKEVVVETVVVEKEVAVEKEVKVPAPAERVKLLFWTYSVPGGEDLNEQRVESLHEEHPEIEVESQMTGWSEYHLKLETGMAAGVMPDVFKLDWNIVPRFAYRGIPLLLSPFMDRDNIDLSRYSKGAIDSGRWDPKGVVTGTGPLWGWAYMTDISLIYYNKDMFRAEGLSYPSPDWTWDDFLEAAIRLTKDTTGDGKIDQWGTWVLPGMQIDRPWCIWGPGGRLISEDHKKATFNSPEAIEGVRWMVEMVTKHKVSPVPGPTEVDPFQSGRVAIHPAGIWMIKAYHDVKEFEWDITMIPKHPKTGIQAGPIDSATWAISSVSKHQDAAWEFVKDLCSAKGMEILSRVRFKVVPMAEVNEKCFFTFPEVPPGGKSLAKALEVARPNPCWVGRQEVWGRSVGPEIEKALRGEKTVEEACEAANVELQKSLDEAWKLSEI